MIFNQVFTPECNPQIWKDNPGTNRPGPVRRRRNPLDCRWSPKTPSQLAQNRRAVVHFLQL